jgi:hypothetical protein
MGVIVEMVCAVLRVLAHAFERLDFVAERWRFFRKAK